MSNVVIHRLQKVNLGMLKQSARGQETKDHFRFRGYQDVDSFRLLSRQFSIPVRL